MSNKISDEISKVFAHVESAFWINNNNAQETKMSDPNVRVNMSLSKSVNGTADNLYD
jgi:hypothetical protein